MRRKSYSLIIMSMCLMVVISACTSKEEKIASIKNEVETLVQAEKYEEAITKYEEILEITDDDIYKDELNGMKQQLEKENELISKLTNYRELLLSIQRDKLAKSRDDIKYIDLHYIVNDIEPMYNELKSIKFEKNTEYKIYVEKLIEAQSKTIVSSLFTKDFATSSEAARRLDLPASDIGGEIGALLDSIEKIDALSKGRYIDYLDNYVRDMLEVPVPHAINN
ncbi:hypothetical protein ABEX25_06630 [Paenibacillus thiaminolyticus]|uniref:hypothetical protein n=1 Tax=Paenibacillus thiaminolyticus TaxID=49283 RepID=UPI003D289714